MQRALCSSWSMRDQLAARTCCTSCACCCSPLCCMTVSPCTCRKSFRKAWKNSKFELATSSDWIIMRIWLSVVSSSSAASKSRTCKQEVHTLFALVTLCTLKTIVQVVTAECKTCGWASAQTCDQWMMHAETASQALAVVDLSCNLHLTRLVADFI